MLELKKDGDLKVMLSTFYCYLTKGLVELGTMIQRSNEDTIRMLQRLKPHAFNDM